MPFDLPDAIDTTFTRTLDIIFADNDTPLDQTPAMRVYHDIRNALRLRLFADDVTAIWLAGYFKALRHHPDGLLRECFSHLETYLLHTAPADEAPARATLLSSLDKLLTVLTRAGVKALTSPDPVDP